MKNHEIERRWVTPYASLPKNICWDSTQMAVIEKNEIMVRFRRSTSDNKGEMTVKMGKGLNRLEFNSEIPDEILDGVFERVPVLGYPTTKAIINGAEFDLKYIKTPDICIIEKEFDTVEEANAFDIKKHFAYAVEVTDDFAFNMLNFYRKYVESLGNTKN